MSPPKLGEPMMSLARGSVIQGGAAQPDAVLAHRALGIAYRIVRWISGIIGIGIREVADAGCVQKTAFSV